MKYTNTKVAVPPNKFSEVVAELSKEGFIPGMFSTYKPKEVRYLFNYNIGKHITWDKNEAYFKRHTHKEISYQEVLGEKPLYDIF